MEQELADQKWCEANLTDEQMMQYLDELADIDKYAPVGTGLWGRIYLQHEHACYRGYAKAVSL